MPTTKFGLRYAEQEEKVLLDAQRHLKYKATTRTLYKLGMSRKKRTPEIILEYAFEIK